MMSKKGFTIVVILLISQFSTVLSYDYPLADVYDGNLFKSRREAVSKSLGKKSALIILSADFYESGYLGDIIEPNANLFYLTGITRQRAILIIAPGQIKTDDGYFSEVIYLREQSEREKKWDGKIFDLINVKSILGIESAADIKDFRNTLEKKIFELDTLYIADYVKSAHFSEGESINRNNIKELDFLNYLGAGLVVKGTPSSLKLMREKKDSIEIALTQRAVDITIQGFLETIKSAASDMREYELQAVMEYNFKKLGAETSAYPLIVASGPNSCIMHYSKNRRKISSGELVLLDCGARFRGYCSDITRTIPINGKFSKEQRIIYNIVIEAQDTAIFYCKAGNSFMTPHIRAMNVITQRLLENGIISTAQDYKMYFPHGVSHYLGLEVHDIGSFGDLKPGNIITVEPGIYIPEGSPCAQKWWNIGIRVEDNILITKDEPVILSNELPRLPDEIEDLMILNK